MKSSCCPLYPKSLIRMYYLLFHFWIPVTVKFNNYSLFSLSTAPISSLCVSHCMANIWVSVTIDSVLFSLTSSTMIYLKQYSINYLRSYIILAFKIDRFKWHSFSSRCVKMDVFIFYIAEYKFVHTFFWWIVWQMCMRILKPVNFWLNNYISYSLF